MDSRSAEGARQESLEIVNGGLPFSKGGLPVLPLEALCIGVAAEFHLLNDASKEERVGTPEGPETGRQLRQAGAEVRESSFAGRGSVLSRGSHLEGESCSSVRGDTKIFMKSRSTALFTTMAIAATPPSSNSLSRRRAWWCGPRWVAATTTPSSRD
ncbi:unnamed protein product [Sphagnum balticum]